MLRDRFRRLGNLIDPFTPADGPPPDRLLPFFTWSLRGSFGFLGIAAAISAISGTLEVVTALLLGRVIDTALAAGPEGFFSSNVVFLTAVLVFFLLIRPLTLGASSAASSVIVMPNVMPMVLSRLHRWTLGQAITFFDNDFAGRIAQKQMQTARALADVANEMINVVFFALASLIGSALLLTTINVELAFALAGWLVCYALLIRWFMPRIRLRSKNRAAARAMVTGQVVDTITNMRTVKLFAHADHEDNAAGETIRDFRERALDFGVTSASFRILLMLLAGLLPVLLIGGALLLWNVGQATPGDIAAAGAIAIRLAQMTGWVSYMLMGLYSSIGEVEDGMRTLTPTYTLVDDHGAEPFRMQHAQIQFEDVGFAYGREAGGVDAINLTIHPGEKIGIVGASGAGKSTLVS